MIDANPILNVSHWLSSETGPTELRSAVADLVSFGPNLLPFLINEFRTETDQMRLYRMIFLLNRVSGINLYYASGRPNFYDAVYEFTGDLLTRWDAGDFTNATAILRKTFKDPDPLNPDSIMPLRRYGVYAVPFIAETLQKRDSPEVFAAFLIITGDNRKYSEYIEHPAASVPTREDKLRVVKTWAAKNLDKMDRLKDLHAQMKPLAGK